jgi:HTH-type transcriptional regulator/antitoxin HigA
MITNERQLRITKSQAERFRAAVRDFNEIPLVEQGIDPVIIAAQRASLQQQLSNLEAEIANYERLRSGSVKRLFASNIPGIGEKLIEARISKGLSQKLLAERLGMKEQQVQRYEQERYLTANLTRVAEVADALQLDLFAFFEAREDTLLDKIAPNLKGAIGFEATKLPVKEMKSRGWLKQVHTPAALPTPTDEELASAFVSQAFQSQLPPSLHKQHVRMGSEQDPYSLLAWKAKVLQKARRISVQLRGGRKPQTLDAHAITRLVGLSAVPDGPVKAVEALQEYGVILVFERHLPLTHLDGAAMLLDNDLPVIALTLRYDRLDNFWFVLAHEMAHVILHRESGLREGFFDEEQAAAQDKLEAEADEFATTAFIPDEVWKRSFVRFTASCDQVHQFALQRKIGVAVVAGRIRRERGDWKLFSELVGARTVRKLLMDAGYWEN